jgi:hypothetical protein
MMLRLSQIRCHLRSNHNRGIASLLEYTPVSRIIPLTAGHIRPSSERVWPAWQEGRHPSAADIPASTRYIPILPRKPLVPHVDRFVRSPLSRNIVPSPSSLDTILSLPMTSKSVTFIIRYDRAIYLMSIADSQGTVPPFVCSTK